MPSADEWSHPNTTQAFQDYFLAKLKDLLTYSPDLVYFDSKFAATIDDAHRLAFLAECLHLPNPSTFPKRTLP